MGYFADYFGAFFDAAGEQPQPEQPPASRVSKKRPTQWIGKQPALALQLDDERRAAQFLTLHSKA